jgi:hypothetical protein
MLGVANIYLEWFAAFYGRILTYSNRDYQSFQRNILFTASKYAKKQIFIDI